MTQFVATKTPNEDKNYEIDWSKDLGTDTISTSTWSVAPAGLTTSMAAIGSPATSTTVFLSGGIAGAVYTVTNTITTAGSLELEKSFPCVVQAYNYLPGP